MKAAEKRGFFEKFASILFALIPSYARLGLILKISLTIFLAGFCADMFYAKLNPAFSLLKDALSFSPVDYAENLVSEGKLKTAEEYIEFYTSIPGHLDNAQLEELKNKIHGERTGIISGAVHQGKNIWKGLKGKESDEFAGQAANAAKDFIPLSDAPDLYAEWQKYSEGKEVDKLSAGLAGIGLALDIADLGGMIGGVFTGGSVAAATHAAVAPVKKSVGLIKRALKIMNPKLRRACNTLFEPVFKQISKMKLYDDLPLPKISGSSVAEKAASLKKFTGSGQFKTWLNKNAGNIAEITHMVQGKLDELGDVMTLAKKDPAAARLVVQNSTSVKGVSSLAKSMLSLGEDGRSIFRFGGSNAVNAVETLGKQGKLSAKTLKQSMIVGETGLKAVAKGCWRSLEKMVNLAVKYRAVLWVLMLQYILSQIPLWLALLVEAFLIAIILKSWGTFFRKAAS